MEIIIDTNKRYSFADYLTWLDDKRRELFEGIVKVISPAPGRIHQQISTDLLFIFRSFLNGKLCKVYHAPFDVRLPINGEKEDNEIFTIVQPDICIVCDPAKLDDRGCLGAPDLIVEIVSPSSNQTDVKDKYVIYEKAGVKEYWIVFPFERVLSVFELKNGGKYHSKGMFTPGDMVPVMIFDGNLVVDVSELFANI
jgi:Uma2 family endonuclease